MKRIVLTVFAASAVALAMAAQAQRPPFNPHQPKIYVVVGNSGAHYAVVDQEPIVIKQQGKSKIKWRIETRGYRFHPTRGIVVPTKASKGISGQVTDCKLEPGTGDREFGCENDNTGKGSYTYTITLVSAKGAVLKKDPWIVND